MWINAGYKIDPDTSKSIEYLKTVCGKDPTVAAVIKAMQTLDKYTQINRPLYGWLRDRKCYQTQEWTCLCSPSKEGQRKWQKTEGYRWIQTAGSDPTCDSWGGWRGGDWLRTEWDPKDLFESIKDLVDAVGSGGKKK